MKWICMGGAVIVALIAELISPWPQFILDTADRVLADPLVANDIVLPTLVKVFFPLVAYMLFPAVAAGIGYFAGVLWERKIQ